MRKRFLMLGFIAVLAVSLVTGCTKGYSSQKSAGDVSITLGAGSYPLVKGDNALTVKMNDASGKSLSDATVNVRYYMPAMPGMAPMEYTTPAALAGDAYNFTANIPMEGGWKVDVMATRGGAALPTVTFNVDAR